LAVSEQGQAERGLHLDADHVPLSDLADTGLARREPTDGAGKIPHRLPDLSDQEAAKIARLLVVERAGLAGQSAASSSAPSAQAGQLPPSEPQVSLPVQRQAVPEAPALPEVPPAPSPAPEPAWYAIGKMVRQWLGRRGAARRAQAAPHSPGPAAAHPNGQHSPVPPAGGPAEVPAVPADPGPAGLLADPGPPDPEPAQADPGTAAPADPAIAAVRDTFAIAKAAGDEAASYFYGWLFVRHPELRELFPPTMNEQRDRLFRALGRIVESLSTPEELAAYLTQLGRDHRKYSVQPEMYEAVGEALLATLRAYAGPTFTPAAEKAWAQAYAAASSLMINAAEEDSAGAPPFWTAEVVLNEQRRPGISILTVAPDQPLPYEPGQQVTVQTPRWPRVWRPYSVSCRPREDGLMTFHVKAVPGGWVSNALVYHSSPGDELILGPALGTMTLHQAGDRDLLCIAGGTGLSPIKAIIEEAVRESTACPRQIYLFCGARTRSELYDLPDLWHLADAYRGFHLTPVTSDDLAFDGMQGNVGRVATRYMPHRECAAYVAGPPAMVRDTVRALARSGLPRERIHYDAALLADDGEPAG
jgi:NAD(P)H-flavin reductase/hemoglobin-like flavoprotein